MIHDALNLDGKVETLKSYYANWAENYDRDVAEEAYTGPRFSSTLFRAVRSRLTFAKPWKFMDAGCGTGLVGVELAHLGYEAIDGFDLSADMVQIAQKLSLYKTLKSNIDLTQPITEFPNKAYHVTFCTGVFTLAHVPPSAMQQLIDLTVKDGIIITSTRTSYYEEYGWESAVNDFIAQNQIKLIGKIWNAPYTKDGNAHYWAHQVLQ